MKQRNNYTRGEERRERPRNAKENRLLEMLRFWGFHTAAANLDTRHLDLDTAINSWANYPKCMDEYPTVITKKVKIDPKDLAI